VANQRAAEKEGKKTCEVEGGSRDESWGYKRGLVERKQLLKAHASVALDV